MKARATIMKAEPLRYGDRIEEKDPLSLQVAAAETPVLPIYWGITQHKDVDPKATRENHVGNARLEWNGYDAIMGDPELFEDLPEELREMIDKGEDVPLSCWYTCNLEKIGDRRYRQYEHHLKHILLTKNPRSPHTKLILGDTEGVIERVIVGDTINFRGDDQSLSKKEKAMSEEKPEAKKEESTLPKQEALKPLISDKTEPEKKQTGLKLGSDMQEFIGSMKEELKQFGTIEESIVDTMTPNQLAKQLKHAKAAKPAEEAGIQDKPAPAGLPPPTKKDEFKDYEYDQHKHGATMTKAAFVRQSNEDYEKHWGKPANVEHTKPPLIGGEGITVSKGPISIAQQKKAARSRP
jgi:hypothetical protein